MRKLLLILLLCLFHLNAKCQKRNTQPNVIIVITDDQGYGDLGAHGNEIIKTPALDTFHNNAVRLTNFHVSPTCAPTRAALMTGRYSNRTGVWHTIGGVSILREDEKTIAQILKENGYKTGLFGKWHLGDNYPARPHDKGFDKAIYHGAGGVGQTPDYWGNDYFDDTYFVNANPTKFKGYCTDIWFNEAIKFIDDSKEQPFFCYISTNAPHSPLNVPEKYYKMYENMDIPEFQKKFYGMITNIDDNFDLLVKHLKKRNLYDNTILIFMTDNGTAWGYKKIGVKEYGYNASMRGIKNSEYEGGHRVPFFISYPNGMINEGNDIDELTAHIDVLPTIAQLCNVSIQNLEIDGIDITPLLTDKNAQINRDYVITDSQRVQSPIKWKKSAVMSDDFRLINGEELYNIKDDPSQKINIAELNADQVKKMRAYYEEWWESVSKKFNVFPIIKVGTHYENPVILTCHDVHIHDSNIPWNQNFIREGLKNPQGGNLSIEFMEDGEYLIELSRWPFEANLSFDASIEGALETNTTDKISKGKPLDVISAELNVGAWNQKKIVSGKEKVVKFKSYFSKGKSDITASFIKGDGTKLGSYYFKITRLMN